MKKYKNKIIIGAVIAAVLAISFWWGGDAPSLRGWEADRVGKVDEVQNENNTCISDSDEENGENPSGTEESEEAEADAEPEAENGGDMTAEDESVTAESERKQIDAADEEAYGGGDIEYSKANGMEIDDETGEDIYKTEPVPEGRPVPVEPEDTEISDRELTCTLSIRCDAIFDHIDRLDPEKRELLPEDGVIFPEQSVKFYDGESVFNLLVREMKRNKIHMEFESTPIYNSAYIEGIGNIYEFDCGELSGWMYRVNGWFPNYGCSRYQLNDGDRVEWIYTCDLGADVGGDYSAKNGK